MEASVFCLRTDWENREMTPLVGEWYKNVTWSSCLFDPCGPVNWEKEDGNGSLPLIQFFFFFYFLFLLFLFLFLRLFLWSSFFSLFPSSSFFLLLHHLPLFFIEMLGSSESSFFSSSFLFCLQYPDTKLEKPKEYLGGISFENDRIYVFIFMEYEEYPRNRLHIPWFQQIDEKKKFTK